ncbi:MAG TPA: CpsB/CapC family capsule biosynthesis tyrosine phosphatase [Solirubrobacteraceae bacterium]|nr:CpsB/CapC family capsule biosynthesis tyrosine phosphatase [Solirubrobacteraceae bacterium]
MIDLHCHILPCLDDGALSFDDSEAMARQAEEDGIEVVCATPHIRHDHNVRIEEIASRACLVQEHLDDRGVGVRVLPGGELAETEADRLTDAQLHSVALGEVGGWLLLEPAPGPLGDSLEACVERLAERGLGTVIAHPERHAGVDFEERLQRLVSSGCLFQWTAQFVADAAPGDLVLRLAGEGLVHLLGSDAHSSYGGRPVRLAAGYERLATVCTAAQITWMVDQAPQAILRGEPVTHLP